MQPNLFDAACDAYWKSISFYPGPFIYWGFWFVSVFLLSSIYYMSSKDGAGSITVGVMSLLLLIPTTFCLMMLNVDRLTYPLFQSSSAKQEKRILPFKREFEKCLTSCSINIEEQDPLKNFSSFYDETNVTVGSIRLSNFSLISGRDVIQEKRQSANAKIISFKERQGRKNLYLFVKVSRDDDDAISGIYRVPMSSFVNRVQHDAQADEAEVSEELKSEFENSSPIKPQSAKGK